MADNTVINAGTGGDTIASDDIGGVKWQRVKAAFGVDGSATDVAPGAGLPTAPAYLEVTGSAAANNTDLVATTDVRNFASFSIQLTGTFSATVRVQGSNDNITWSDQLLQKVDTNSTSAAVFASAVGIWVGTVTTRYLRVRTTAYTSGTVSAVVELSSAPQAHAVPQVGIAGSVNLTSIVSPTSAASGNSDGTTGSLVFPVAGYAAVSATTWDRLRIPNVFKTIVATASGNTALWTPTSGKKFRLMRYRLEVTSDAAMASGGLMTIKMQDATTDIAVAHSVYVPAVSGTAFGSGYQPGWVDLGNGIISAAANNVLNVNLSATLTSGTCRVMCAGTEE